MVKQGYLLEAWYKGKCEGSKVFYGLPYARKIAYRLLKDGMNWKGEIRMSYKNGKPLGVIKERHWMDEPPTVLFFPYGWPEWKPSHKVRPDGTMKPIEYINMDDVRRRLGE